MKSLTVRSRRLHDVCVLELSGVLMTGPSLKELMSQARNVLETARPSGVILDLSDLAQVDSAGLGEFVALYTLAGRHNVKLATTGVTPRVRSLLETTRLDAMFPEYPSEAEALSALESRS